MLSDVIDCGSDLSSQNSDQQYQAKELEVSPAATNTIALIRTLGAMPKRKENELIIEPVRLYPSILKGSVTAGLIKNMHL